MNSFLELSFEEMLIEFTKDTQDTFSLIFKDLFSRLEPSQKNKFISELCKTFEKVAKDPTRLNLSKSKFQTRLLLIPQILLCLYEDIKGATLISLFETFNKIERLGLSELTETCLSLGKELIGSHPADLNRLISSQVKKIDAEEPLITPIVFVAECARVNPHLASQTGDLQKDLERLLIVQDKVFLTSLAKQIRHLMRFIKDPQVLLDKLFNNILENKARETLIGNSYFCAGLLKGLGVRFFKEYGTIRKMQQVFDSSKKKDYKDIKHSVRKGCVILAEALWDVFDRLLEPSLKELLDFLLKFLGDSSEEIRELTRAVMNKIMIKISEFGIKQILPILMRGTTDKNSKTKYNSILALGAIANCGTKQLSQNLPKIVPQLTEATNDTNDLVNSAAKKSLSLILGTIRSIEVSNLRKTLILSLSDPFNYNERSLDALLKTTFKHALDGPSLSLIVPIALYGCKPLNSDASKKKAAQLIATMIKLVPNSADFLPYLEPLAQGLKANLREISPDVRAMAAKAFSALTKKFKNEMGMKFLNDLKSILESEDANSTERAGYAQAFAEVMHSLGNEVSETLIPLALELTQDSREHIRESFLSVFVYLPMVMQNHFIKYVKDAIEQVVESISHEKERIRNLAIKSLKIIIQNYLQNDFQVLLNPLFEGSLSENPNKKNSSLILLGDIIQMLINDEKLTRDFIYENYSRIFSLFYIIKNDDNSEVRDTAKNIYKTFIPNTQRCLRIIFKDLHECFIELFSREQESIRGLATNGLKEFGNKFADTFASQMLNLSQEILQKRMHRHKELANMPVSTQDPNSLREMTKLESLLAGQSRFIAQFVANCNAHALEKIKKMGFIGINDMLCGFEKELVWLSAFEGLKIFIERENDTQYAKQRLEDYSKMLTAHEKAEKAGEEEHLLPSIEYEKMKKFFSVMLSSEKESLLRITSSYFITQDFKEWQFEIVLQNLKLFGKFLYSRGFLETGLDLFFICYQNKLAEEDSPGRQEFLTMNKFTLNTLSVNVDPSNVVSLLEEFQEKLTKFSTDSNGIMILLTLESLQYFFEKNMFEDVQFPFFICSTALSLISYQGEFKQEIYGQVGTFLEVLFRFFDKENCAEVMTGIYQTLLKIVEDNSQFEGLSDPKIVHCLFNLISVVLKYSTPDSALTALKTSKFLIQKLPAHLLDLEKKQFYASIMRLLIYKYSMRRSKPEPIKRKMFEFLTLMLEKKMDMGVLRHQFLIYLVFMINGEFKVEAKEKSLNSNEEEIEETIETENISEPGSNQMECSPKKKKKKIKSLREVYMDYLITLAVYYDSLLDLVSNWERKVRFDSDHYSVEAFKEFVQHVQTLPEEKVSAATKTKIEDLLELSS